MKLPKPNTDTADYYIERTLFIIGVVTTLITTITACLMGMAGGLLLYNTFVTQNTSGYQYTLADNVLAVLFGLAGGFFAALGAVKLISVTITRPETTYEAAHVDVPLHVTIADDPPSQD